MTLKYYHNLDGLRGIAAIMVVVFHFFTYQNSSYVINLANIQRLTEFGQHGVSLFFVLSGFVITRILINSRGDDNYFRRFYWRRILRILPLYYFFLLVYYLTDYLIQGQMINFLLQLPFYFYLQNLTGILQIPASGPGHYWTLAVEEHFYLLWPLGIHFINPKYLGKFIIYIILLIFILKYFMLESGYSINKFTLTRMDQLLMGAFIAFLEVKGFFKEIRNLRKIIWIGPLIFILGILTYLFQEIFPMAKEMFKYPILGLLFFMIICFLIFKDSNNVFNRVLTHPSLQYLGKISYGIYVWHVLVLNLLSSYFISEIILLDLFLSIVLTIIIAHLSYYYFEVLFLKLKDYSFKPIRQIITK